jgi:hypothetical protein
MLGLIFDRHVLVRQCTLQGIVKIFAQIRDCKNPAGTFRLLHDFTLVIRCSHAPPWQLNTNGGRPQITWSRFALENAAKTLPGWQPQWVSANSGEYGGFSASQ